jgi:hemerythrin-like metal-binding protein
MDMPNHPPDLSIKVIDRDHREIADLLMEINFNVTRDGDAGRRISRLREMARATRSHFLLEESMMAATRFPGLALHQMRHHWMLQQIRQLATYWGEEKNALTREPMAVLWESYVAHLESEDRSYGLWMGASRSEQDRERDRERARVFNSMSSSARRASDRSVLDPF